MNAKSLQPYVVQLDLSLAPQLKNDLAQQGFDLSVPQHTIFSGKKKGISCTLYKSGKLVIQGKSSPEFIEFYLEPEILKDFSLTYKKELSPIDPTPRIGQDESGKGDFFGPLCIAGVGADEAMLKQLREWEVDDSKTLSDKKILKIAPKIKQLCPFEIILIFPKKYNELYAKFRNLNHLLTWAHARVAHTLFDRTHFSKVIIDQFANEKLLYDAIQAKNSDLKLEQRHRAEEDIVVAAASMLARSAFLQGLERLEKEYQISLPKGASASVIKMGKLFVAKHGEEALEHVGKLHFKTREQILK